MKQNAKRGKAQKNPVKELLLQIGEVVKKERREQELTYEALAKMAGVSVVYISGLEKGKYDNISFEVVNNIASALGLSFTAKIE